MHAPVPRVCQVLSLPIPGDGRTVFVLQTRVLWQEGEHVDFMSTKVKLTWLQNFCTLLKTTHHR